MRLIVETSKGDQAYLLAEGRTVIGRDRACDVRIHDPSVSRRHLECALTTGDLVVKDLNTRNGTYLGTQRVEEVRVTPGLRLCLGTVHVRFEQDAPEPPPPQAAPPEADFEQDDEPTPLDEHVAQSVLADAAGNGTRLVVRDNRWFVQDVETGSEFEIVPQQDGGQPGAAGETPLPGRAEPLPASGTAMVLSRGSGAASALSGPATATPVSQVFSLKGLLADPRKRRTVLLAAVGLVVLLVLALLWFKPPEERDLMSPARYRALVDDAVLAFGKGQRADAMARLETLSRTPVQGRHELAGILLDAMKTDEGCLSDFSANWQQAQTRWRETRDSAESTVSAQALAQKRLDWLIVEFENLIHMNEARASLEAGDLLACLDAATLVPEDSLLYAEAQSLVGETLNNVVAAAEKAATANASAQKWAAAMAELEKIKKYKPERASEAEEKIKVYRTRTAEEAALAQAQKLAKEQRFAEAKGKLDEIATDSPYAKTAASLKKTYARSGTLQQAQAAYAAGDGKKALALLAEIGGANTSRNIQEVMKYRENADKALEVKDFDAAATALKGLVAREKDEKNRYRQTADRQLASMPTLRKRYAQDLMNEAATANREGRFAETRALYEKAIKVHDESRSAAFAELDKLRDAAKNDYNIAVGIEKEHPQRALKLYQDVMSRLPTHDTFYRRANMRIIEVELRLELEKREQ